MRDFIYGAGAASDRKANFRGGYFLDVAAEYTGFSLRDPPGDVLVLLPARIPRSRTAPNAWPPSARAGRPAVPSCWTGSTPLVRATWA